MVTVPQKEGRVLDVAAKSDAPAKAQANAIQNKNIRTGVIKSYSQRNKFGFINFDDDMPPAPADVRTATYFSYLYEMYYTYLHPVQLLCLIYCLASL